MSRLGDNASDLELSDPGSVTSSESESESESDSEDEDGVGGPSLTSSSTSLPLSAPSNLVAQADSAARSEFRHEVTQSLDRAFAEGHSVDNAAVELKTLRMASNVPLRLVREAVVAAIVSRIKIVEAGLPQRQEIAAMIGRWGGLIDKIGGVDAVETIEILQVMRNGRLGTCVSIADIISFIGVLRFVRTFASFRADSCCTIPGRHCGGRRHSRLA